MKVIVAGSRSVVSYGVVSLAISASKFEPTEIVSGTARGVDRLGESWANNNGVTIKRFPADWTQYGKAAGHIRNAQMAEYADALVAVWDGNSRGTEDMIALAEKHGLKVYVYPA